MNHGGVFAFQFAAVSAAKAGVAAAHTRKLAKHRAPAESSVVIPYQDRKLDTRSMMRAPQIPRRLP